MDQKEVQIPPISEPNLSRETHFKLGTHDQKQLSAVIRESDLAETHGTILLLPGSGRVDVDGDVSSPFVGFGYQGQSAKLSLQLAEELAKIGYRTLRYAKRGFDDEAEMAKHDMFYLLQDAEAAFNHILTNYPESKINVIGFSEGAILALLLAKKYPHIDTLNLIAVPLKNIDEILRYQFIKWPLKILKENIDLDQDGNLTLGDFADRNITLIPGTMIPAKDLFQNKEKVAIHDEVTGALLAHFEQIKLLTQTPPLAQLFDSMRSIGDAEKYLSGSKAQSTHLYMSFDDSQVDIDWLHDPNVQALYAAKKMNLHIFRGVGHCFAPYEGQAQEIKTSGPFGEDLVLRLKLVLKHSHQRSLQ